MVPNNKFGFGRRQFFAVLIAVVVAAAALLVGFAVHCLRVQSDAVRNAYCLDWASAAIVQYMDEHDGLYPCDWAQLQEAFEQVTANDRSFGFEEVRSRVVVDFSVDPKMPQDASFAYIRVRRGPDARWGAPDPNERIRLNIPGTQRPSR